MFLHALLELGEAHLALAHLLSGVLHLDVGLDQADAAEIGLARALVERVVARELRRRRCRQWPLGVLDVRRAVLVLRAAGRRERKSAGQVQRGSAVAAPV